MYPRTRHRPHQRAVQCPVPRRRGGTAALQFSDGKKRKKRSETANRRTRNPRRRGYPRAESRTDGAHSRRAEIPRLCLGAYDDSARHPQLHSHDRQPPVAPHHPRREVSWLLGTRHNQALAERPCRRKQVDFPLPRERRRDVQHSDDLRTRRHSHAGRARPRTSARKLRRIRRSLSPAQVPALLRTRQFRHPAAHFAAPRIPRR